MFYWLSLHYSTYFHVLHVAQYLTFRSICCAMTSLFLALFLCPMMIERLKSMQVGQQVRSDGPKSHLQKSGTPTMGGVVILFSIMVSVLLWCDLSNSKVWILLLVMLFFGGIGFIDDYLKVVKKNTKGLSAKHKFLSQFALALMVASFLYVTANSEAQTHLLIPFCKGVSVSLGVGFILFTMLVIVGASNAVNLTDGLDGLALMPTVLIAMALAVFAYLSGNAIFSKYLLILHVAGSGE